MDIDSVGLNLLETTTITNYNEENYEVFLQEEGNDKANYSLTTFGSALS